MTWSGCGWPRCTPPGSSWPKGGAGIPTAAEFPQVPTQSTVHVDLAALDLTIRASQGPARVIGVVPGQVVTEDLRLEPTIAGGQVVADSGSRCGQDRRRRAAIIAAAAGAGAGEGDRAQAGAIASSVAHDSHNVVVVGTADADMRAAVAAIVEMGGGQVALADGRVQAACPLPIAGLMSDRPLEEVRDQVAP